MADFTPINSQEELNNVIGERLRRERETVTKEFEQKIADKDAEITKYQTDLETANKSLEDANTKLAGIPDLENKIKAYETASVKSKVARETGIPYELAERLTGATEEELRKDAEALKKLMGTNPQQTAPLAGGERGGKQTGKDAENAGWLKVIQDMKGD